MSSISAGMGSSIGLVVQYLDLNRDRGCILFHAGQPRDAVENVRSGGLSRANVGV
jgi:hypothetical protein